MPEEHYLDHPRMDDLARMITELTSEVWILRDRLTLLERTLEDGGQLEREALERGPEEGVAQELEREREALTRRVLGAPVADDYTVQSLMEHGHR